MARTNIDIDEESCARVMARYDFSTKRDAVNFALRHLAVEPLSVEEILALRGMGWEADLDAMRRDRVPR